MPVIEGSQDASASATAADAMIGDKSSRSRSTDRKKDRSRSRSKEPGLLESGRSGRSRSRSKEPGLHRSKTATSNGGSGLIKLTVDDALGTFACLLACLTIGACICLTLSVFYVHKFDLRF